MSQNLDLEFAASDFLHALAEKAGLTEYETLVSVRQESHERQDESGRFGVETWLLFTVELEGGGEWHSYLPGTLEHHILSSFHRNNVIPISYG